MIFNCVAAISKKFLGIKLARQTDLVSLTALLLSILTAVLSTSYFLYGFVNGANVDMYLHEQVILKKSEKLGKGKKNYLRLGGTVIFSNGGQIGYDAVIKQVSITLKFSDNSEYKQDWHEFVTFTNKGRTLERKGDGESAAPLQIKAGSALSRDIYFKPIREPCKSHERTSCKEWHNFFVWEDFMTKLKRSKGQNLTLTVTAESFKDEKWVSSCIVKVNNHIITELGESGDHAPSCWSLNEKGISR